MVMQRCCGCFLNFFLETVFCINKFSHPLVTVEPQALLGNSWITSNNSAVWLQERSKITAFTLQSSLVIDFPTEQSTYQRSKPRISSPLCKERLLGELQ